ncbi:MAG: hypothetical protein M3Q07_13115 [Pseudobdellovibrionaceae bacterium]|nr:hypothetical protein [Pseudobdellovibrionaceae bacterium]
MTAVQTLDDSFGGVGRCRKKKAPKTNRPSHYQFALWNYEDGKRHAVPVGGVKTDKRAEYPLISTALKNEGTQTETLIWLHFDLDFERAERKWRANGKLDWPLIGGFLKDEIPALFKYLTAVTRSSGGKGLGLVLSISPLELINETADVQKLAFRLQAMIIHILNYYKMGADEGARGLKRLMPNLFQVERLLDRDEVTEALIQKKRPRVIQNLLFDLRFHRALRPKAKRDRDDILWTDIRVELPCARLYTDLLDCVGPWGSEQKTVQEIMRCYGLSKNTVYKLFSDPPKWLGVQHVRGEGFRLTIRPFRELTDRAYELIEVGGEGRSRGAFPAFQTAAIEAPEMVLKGERNCWLVSIAVACKWKGIDRSTLEEVLKRVVSRVPNFHTSRSLTRELKSILRSIYHHRSSRKACNTGLVLPEWLSDALDSNQPKQLSQTLTKKGTSVAGSQAANSDLKKDGLSSTPGIAGKQKPSSPTPGGVMPGARGWPAPSDDQGGVYSYLSREDVEFGQGLTGAQSNPMENSSSEAESAFLEEGFEKMDFKNSVLTPESGSDNSWSRLTGSALSVAFSKALMKSTLSAAEKARILTLVTSETDSEKKEDLRRAWLLKLSAKP